MGAPEVEAFLTMLATERKVSSATHNQALSAILFLYREVLGVALPWLENIRRPAYKRRIPSVLTRDKVAAVLALLQDEPGVLARLLYGTGMRLMEGLRLRIKDVDFDRHAIVVREGKGGKDRVVMLPHSLAASLRTQLLAARAMWESDRQQRRGGVEVPHALQAKYPQLANTWGWFWLFPSPTLSVDPHTGEIRRHHLFEERLQRALKRAVARHRHPHRAGAAGPQRCQHHDDLHARAQGRGRRHRVAARCAGAASRCRPSTRSRLPRGGAVVLRSVNSVRRTRWTAPRSAPSLVRVGSAAAPRSPAA